MGVISNDANTFRPYDPNEAIGSTQPGLPFIQPPSVGNCGMIVRVFAVVVAAVVAYYTWDPGTAFSVYAAIVGAGGEAVAQTIEIREGARQGYSAAGIVGAGLGAGFGGASGIENVYANAAVVAANSYTSNYALSKVFNEEAHFSWRKMLGQVAAAVVTAGIFGNKNPTAKDLAENSRSAAQSIASTKFDWKQVAAHAMKEFGKNLGREVVGGYVNAAITGDKYRFDGRHAFASAAANAFGNTAIMAGNGAFRIQAEPESGYTLYDVTANDPFAVQQIQEFANESMGGLLSDYGYNATLDGYSTESTRLANIAADRSASTAVRFGGQPRRTNDLSWLQSAMEDYARYGADFDVNGDGQRDSYDRVIVTGLKDGRSGFSGTGDGYLRYLWANNRPKFEAANQMFGRGNYNRWAGQYNYQMVDWAASTEHEAAIRQSNSSKYNQELKAYLGRAYPSRAPTATAGSNMSRGEWSFYQAFGAVAGPVVSLYQSGKELLSIAWDYPNYPMAQYMVTIGIDPDGRYQGTMDRMQARFNGVKTLVTSDRPDMLVLELYSKRLDEAARLEASPDRNDVVRGGAMRSGTYFEILSAVSSLGLETNAANLARTGGQIGRYSELSTVRTWQDVGVSVRGANGGRVADTNSLASRRPGGIRSSDGLLNVNGRDIAQAIDGHTLQSTKIANAIRRGDIKVSVLGDEFFENAVLSKGDPIDTVAMAASNRIYLRRSSANILTDAVHEGTHALDYLNGFGLNSSKKVWQWEKRAYFYENQFQKSTGTAPDFATPRDMMFHIWMNYKNEPYLPK